MKKNIIPLVVFTALSLAMTYPLVNRITTHIPSDLGDPLLNSWILNWDIKKMLTGMHGYWDGNIFYPYRLTLAFSENILGMAVFGLPVMAATKNIILTYNLLFLSTFVLSGFGAYLLVKYLTGNPWAGLISGIIFAFAPYRFEQISHIQVLNMQWLPFIFLYLHKYLKTRKPGHALLFILFYLLQFSSSMYNGLFITVFIMFFVLYYHAAGIMDRKTALKVFACFIPACFLLLPILYPYVNAKKIYGFERDIVYTMGCSAHVESYFSANPANRIYGNLTHRLWKNETGLFMGLTALMLALLNFSLRKKPEATPGKRAGIFLTAWKILTVALLLIMLVFLLRAGKPFIVSGKMFDAGSMKPFTLLALLLIIRFCSDKEWRNRLLETIKLENIDSRFYLFVIFLGVLLSFGPQIQFFDELSWPGIHPFFYYLFPGFSGIRTVARFGILAMLGTSVLAGYGFNSISRKYRFSALGILFSILLLAEYFSAPMPVREIETANNIPPVYKWMQTLDNGTVFLELPMKGSDSLMKEPGLDSILEDIKYVYYSSYHGRKIFNGYSGYTSPAFEYLSGIIENFPEGGIIPYIKRLGINYVVIHTERYGHNWPEIDSKLNRFREELAPVRSFGQDRIYRVAGSSFCIPAPEPAGKEFLLSKSNWKIEANVNPGKARYAIDNSLATRWDAGDNEIPGAYILLDLGNVYGFNRLLLDVGNKYKEYPMNYMVEVSEDKKRWKIIVKNGIIIPELYLSYLYYSPKDARVDIKFGTQEARYIRITQNGFHKKFNTWVLYEIDVVK